MEQDEKTFIHFDQFEDEDAHNVMSIEYLRSDQKIMKFDRSSQRVYFTNPCNIPRIQSCHFSKRNR
jgi:hypothetical protein